MKNMKINLLHTSIINILGLFVQHFSKNMLIFSTTCYLTAFLHFPLIIFNLQLPITISTCFMTEYEFWECNLYLDRQITKFKETQFNNNISYTMLTGILTFTHMWTCMNQEFYFKLVIYLRLAFVISITT